MVKLKIVYMTELPPCDFCSGASIGIKKSPEELAQVERAMYDAPTKSGPWAYVCRRHFKSACFPTGGFQLALRDEK